jgi:ABC-type transport system involved in cytochrome c biogenesis ATPase subunit
MTERAIDVHDLRRSYGELEAVRGISFRVAPGEVFCPLGPNGAGKTTTTEILEGCRTRTAGDVRLLGFDPAAGERAFRERVGIVLQESGVHGELTVELVDAKERTRVKSLSAGQRRRLDLALALVGDPDLLFLGEREALGAAGIAVDADVPAPELPPDAEAVLAWAVREGTTNVLRHAGARRVAIHVRAGDAHASVEVLDDGRGAEGTSVDDGSGLAGLAERVARFQGRLEAAPRAEGGFRLAVSLPLGTTA